MKKISKVIKGSKKETSIVRNTTKLINFVAKNKRFPTLQDDESLYLWISQVRQLKKTGLLTEEHSKRLDSIDFIWDKYAFVWHRKFELLKNVLTNTVQLDNAEKAKVFFLFNDQCNVYETKKLRQGLRIEIESLDLLIYNYTGIYPIEASDTISEEEKKRRWQNNFDKLLEFRLNNPFTYLRANYFDFFVMNLYKWYNRQLEDYANGRLTDEQRTKLDNSTIARVTKDDIWLENFNSISNTIKTTDRISYKIDPLYVWSAKQFRLFNELSKEKQAHLNSIRFKTFFTETDWERKFRRLVVFVDLNKKTPTKGTNLILSNWLTIQRSSFRTGKLSATVAEKIKKYIPAIKRNQDWNEVWQIRYNELKQFLKDHDNEWPKRFTTPITHSLFGWCQVQRQKVAGSKKNYKTLSTDKVALLNELGFRWSDNGFTEKKWNAYYLRLKNYIQETGNIEVPQFINNEKNGVFWWVGNQKKAFLNNRMAFDKVEKLRELGIVWHSA